MSGVDFGDPVNVAYKVYGDTVARALAKIDPSIV